MAIVVELLLSLIRGLWAPHRGRHVAAANVQLEAQGTARLPRRVPGPRPVEPEASLVRPYVVAWEAERERRRADRSRLGVAVLLDVAEAEVREVAA